MNIYAKLTLLCLFLVVVSSSVIFIFTNLKVKKAYSEEILISATKQAESTISNIEQFIFSRINDVRMATKNPYFRIEDISANELTSRLQELEKLNNLYYSFTFYNNDGVRIADSKRLSIGKSDTSNLLWKKLSSETPSTMAVSRSPELDRVMMQFGATVNDFFDQKPSGVLVGSILLDELFKIMGDITLSSDSTHQLEVNLINEEGIILYSNDPQATPLVSAFTNFNVVKDAKGSRVNVVETNDKLYFVAHQQSYLNYEGNDWILCVSTDKESIYAPLKDVQSQILLIILGVLGVSLVLALIAANLFLRPIIRLSKYAEEIGSGNLDVEVDIRSNDEIGKLAKTLSIASKSLVDRIEQQKETNKQLEQQKSEIENQKGLLEQVNQQISDSIIYAQRIQNAILPDLKSIDRLVNDAFVIFKPKDVVSGDFYWFERIRQGRNEYLVIACADCTGHGVPGAIMSIMGSNQLTNIIYYQNYLDPNKILARLDKLIKMELQKDNEENRDGMEIGICVINLDDLKMEFSGAGIPLHLVRNNELTTYRSPKVMIGGVEGDEREAAAVLNKEEIQLIEGDRLFLASDGFQDQFGGPSDKKFMGKNLKSLIEDSSSKTLKESKEAMEKTFEDWKGNTPQTDDVLVLGIEI